MKTEENHEWTPEEITFLRENWQKLTDYGIQSSIGIKEREVRRKRRALGLIKGRKEGRMLTYAGIKTKIKKRSFQVLRDGTTWWTSDLEHCRREANTIKRLHPEEEINVVEVLELINILEIV